MQLVETTRISQPGARAIEPTVIAELGAPFGLALPGPFADQHHARVAILARQRETRLTTDANPPDPGVGEQAGGEVVGGIGAGRRLRPAPVELAGKSQRAENRRRPRARLEAVTPDHRSTCRPSK